MDSAVLWHPTEDALMVVAGVRDLGTKGSEGLAETWFFRDVPPQVASVTISPSAPYGYEPVVLSTGPVTGGYGVIRSTYSWYVNGAVVPDVTGTALLASYFGPLDTIQAKVQLTDALEVIGPSVSSAVITVLDLPPSIDWATIVPNPGFVYSTLTATPTNVRDPDGDAVTVHYAWTVDGLPAGTDTPTLASSVFHAGSAIMVTVTPMDRWGLAGTPVTATDSIAWSLVATDSRPGGLIYVSGSGFGAQEQVAIHLDAIMGTLIGSATTDPAGAFLATSFVFPSPVTGGTHTLYGVGQESGIVGPGPVKVIPAGSIIPSVVAAGVATSFTGVGFAPGETVSVSFAGGAPAAAGADSTGSVTLSLVSPPEPWPSGTVTASAPSGTATVPFTVSPKLTVPATGVPLAPTPFSVTGFGAGETVQISFDSTPAAGTFTTDASGSGSGTIVLPSTFGNHSATATGLTSGAKSTVTIPMPATMTVAPTSGPSGTVITVDSGPGWVPGSTITMKWAFILPVKELTADSSGKVHTTWTIPISLPLTYYVYLMDTVLGQMAAAPFTVTLG